MKKKLNIITHIIVVLAIIFGLPCYGAEIDLPKPTNDFFVNDFAGVLDSQTEQDIQNIAVQLQEKTTAQAVVITIKSLEGESLEEYALKLFREWGIGTAEKNNGVLILIAIDDRLSRIEVGYGLEGALPDGKTGRIQDEYMIPYFQDDDYASGIKNGYLALVREVYNEYGIDIGSLENPYELEAVRTSRRENGSSNNAVLIIIAIIVLLIDWIFLRGRITRFLMMVSMASRRGGGSHRGGGGGFSGGGGRSGGGGSSRGW